jgi:hypothetical protein
MGLHGGHAAQVDCLGGRSGLRAHRVTIADGKHPPAADRDRPGDGASLVAGDDARTVEDKRAHQAFFQSAGSATATPAMAAPRHVKVSR